MRIWGENYEDKDGATEEQKKEGSRAFTARPKWAQALVLVAGVTMNILFAWLLFSLTYMIGVPTAVDETTASPEAELYIASVLPDSPAAVIPPGAVVTRMTAGDVTLEKPTAGEFSKLIQSVAPASVSVTYLYGGDSQVVEIIPEQNVITDNPERYAVGASLAMVETIRQPIFTALYNGLLTTKDGLVGITVGLFSLIAQSFTGEADFSQVAGPVGIVGMVGDAAAFGITALLTFTAIISLNLAVINLLPFPALDGGRLVFVAIETLTGRPIPPSWAGRLNLVGFALLMLLMIAVTYNDIIKLL